MKKQVISLALSAVVTLSSIAAMSTNALGCIPTRVDSEEYQNSIKPYENMQLLTEQETEYFRNILSMENITKVWRRYKTVDTSDEYSRFDVYSYEYELKDALRVKFDLPIEDGDLISSELADSLGYDSYYSINSSGRYTDGNCAAVSISFNDSDHEMNYMIIEKALSILSEKYTIKEKELQFDAVNHCCHIRLQSCLTTVYGNAINGVQLHKMTEQEFKEFYDSIDHDYIKENFRAVYNAETGFIEFPDDYTQEEKLGCFSYFAENFDAKIHEYCKTSASEPISVEFSDEISYVDGDANRDKITTIADAAAIFQSLANPDKYQLSAQGEFNADSKGDGLTVDDAVRIQKKLAGITE